MGMETSPLQGPYIYKAIYHFNRKEHIYLILRSLGTATYFILHFPVLFKSA